VQFGKILGSFMKFSFTFSTLVINSGKGVRNVARTLNVHPSTISSVFKGLMKRIVRKEELDKAENGKQIS
jgi:hypothetical protein